MTAGPSTAMQSSVLVLNRLYMAIQVMSVRRAFCLLFKDFAEVINIENGTYVSYNFEIQVPRVIRLLRYDLYPKNVVKFNRRNIFLRDENRCQYCSHRFPTQQLILDHVTPRSRGGLTNCVNIVFAFLR